MSHAKRSSEKTERGSPMLPASPSSVMARMNTAFNAIYGTMSGETMRRAEKIFYSCHDWLQERGIAFHQTIDGRWVLDEKQTERQGQDEKDM